MSETTEPLAPQGADAPVSDAPVAEAPRTIEQTLAAAYDAAQDAPEGETRARDESGRFVGDAPKVETEAAPAVEVKAEPVAPVAPAMPDYIAPYVADFALKGVPVEKAVPYILDIYKGIEADPQKGIQWLAGRYGLTVSFGGQQAPQAQSQPAPADPDAWVDPAVAKLQEEVNAMRAERQREQQDRQLERDTAYRQAYASVKTEVDQFEASKKGDGVDFNVLRPLMQTFIGAGQAETLEQAYDMAVRAHPQTYATLEAALRKEAEEAAAKRLAAARSAAATNVRGDVGAGSRPRTIAESLARAFDAAQAGA